MVLYKLCSINLLIKIFLPLQTNGMDSAIIPKNTNSYKLKIIRKRDHRESNELKKTAYHENITFPNSIGFYNALNKRVNRFFEENDLPKTGDWRMFLKTGIIISLLFFFYIFLVFFSNSLPTALFSGFALAQSFALFTMNVMHDGGHKSYSKNKLIGKLAGLSPDFGGLSKMLWVQRHNLLHHYYTNINELDNDIQIVGNVLRLSPEQKWRNYHRFQHLYAFPLYGLLTLSWVLFSDFQKIITGKIGNYKTHKPTCFEISFLLFAKFFYIGYMLAIPSIFHPFLHVIIGFLGVHLVFGFTISIIFQLAHTVQSNTFPRLDITGIMEKEWAIHQVETTSNFAPTNKLAAWYFGGLNFQIEHHLFPNICHIHYPAISKIVRETCKEFNILYVSYQTVFSAIAAHYKFLKAIGSSFDKHYLS